MKKRFLLIVLLLALSVMVSSCNNNSNEEISTYIPDNKTQENLVGTSSVWIKRSSLDYSKYNLSDYSVGILDYSDNSPVLANYGVVAKIYDEKEYKEIIPASEKTIIVGGKEINGYYKETYNRPNNYYPSYKYRIYDRKGSFAVDEAGRIISYINYVNLNNVNTSDTDEVFSDDKYITIARDFVEDIQGKANFDWTCFNVTVQKDKGMKGYYTVLFEKCLRGMKTAEAIFVRLTYAGKICSFSSDMLGRVPEDIDLSLLDLETAKACVCNRLDGTYNGLSKETLNQYKIEYSVPEPTISVLSDGTPCYIFEVDVKTTPVGRKDGYISLVIVIVAPNK